MRVRSIVAIVATGAVAASIAAGAAGAPFTPREIRGERVGPNTLLWAHVFHRAQPQATSTACFDNNSWAGSVPSFTDPNEGGVTFTPSTTFASDGKWPGAFSAALDAWDDEIPGTYFALSGTTPSVSRPSKRRDDMNYVGLAALGGRTLAVTYTWSIGGEAVESDVYFNSRVGWDTLTYLVQQTCPSGTMYDMQAIATHELGHVLGLDHVSEVTATMAPTASAGETRKRTLTAGETNKVSSFP